MNEKKETPKKYSLKVTSFEELEKLNQLKLLKLTSTKQLERHVLSTRSDAEYIDAVKAELNFRKTGEVVPAEVVPAEVVPAEVELPTQENV